MTKPCTLCGTLTNHPKARCPSCRNATPRPSAAARGYGSTWRRLRLTILERDRHTCYACGGPANTVDHLTPKALGGPDEPWNLAACCTPCQNRKGDQARRRAT